jgi:predicted PhzF superfamily epimerase YddE/YHI9
MKITQYQVDAFTTRVFEGNPAAICPLDQWLEMDFPASPPVSCKIPEVLIQGLGMQPIEFLAADDYVAVFEDESTILAIKPNHTFLSQLGLRGLIVTALGNNVDFVSRFFAPKLGIPEDPVTGSAHCELAPYWANKLGKNKLSARQVSRRGGNIHCEVVGDRVLLSGSAVTFMVGEVNI